MFDHTSENEQIDSRFYTREEVRELIQTEQFSSRAQLAAYFFALGALTEERESGDENICILSAGI